MEINAGTSESEGTKKEVRKVEMKTLRKVIVKIGLERIDTQEGITVEALLDNGATELVISLEFAKKTRIQVKKA